MMCNPGIACFTCKADDCIKGSSSHMSTEEKKMLRASGLNFSHVRENKKGSGEGATSTEPVNKTSIYIIPQLRHMKPVAQNEARTYKIPKDCIEMWLRSVYGLKCQPVVAPLKDKAKFRREIAKESGLYVDY